MATTDEKRLATGPGDEPTSAADSTRGERRRRAHDILSGQRSLLDRLENQLTEQLEQLTAEVAQSARLAENAAGQGESAALAALEAQFDALKRQFAALDAESEQIRGQLEQAQVERGRAEQELRIRDALLKETQGNDEERRVELAALRERLADAEARLAAAHERHSALERELADARERADAEQEETKAQRRRIAREFKQQHAERIAEFERRKAELQALAGIRDAQLEEQAAAARAELQASLSELGELREALARRAAGNDETQRTIEALESEAARVRALLEQGKAAHAAEIERLRNAAPQPGDPGKLRELEQERARLAERLASAEARLTEQAVSDKTDSQEMDDLRRRFEMAVEEVRELKHANAELESKVKSRGNSGSIVVAGGGMDWEAQKQRLLASLEADDDDGEETVAERASIEGTIRITDQIVAQKDQEIVELKAMLERSPSGLLAASNHSAAVAEVLDRDELIRQEREKLAQTRVEWRERIGQAEIDISVQRAKIARERAELDEKIRQYEADQERRASTGESTDPSKPTRGRWLARLGLKDIDESK